MSETHTPQNISMYRDKYLKYKTKYLELVGGKGRGKKKKTKKSEDQVPMTSSQKKKFETLRKNAGAYAPKHYFDGLSFKEATTRLERIQEGSKTDSRDTKAYRNWETDYRDGQLIQTKPSRYTQQWRRYFPDVTSLQEKSELTGVPMDIIDEVYRKGAAAWRTGHRPGAGKEQWGHARVNSFLVKGKTFYTADFYLAKRIIESKAKKYKKAQKWFRSIDGLCDERKKYTIPDFCEKKPEKINFGK
jgi:hypothetical protein